MDGALIVGEGAGAYELFPNRLSMSLSYLPDCWAGRWRHVAGGSRRGVPVGGVPCRQRDRWQVVVSGIDASEGLGGGSSYGYGC